MTSGLPLNTDEVGIFSIVYDVIDTAGNQASATRTVEVTPEGSVCPAFPPPLLPSFEILQPDADTIWAAQSNFKINILWEVPPDVVGVRISLLSDSEEVNHGRAFALYATVMATRPCVVAEEKSLKPFSSTFARVQVSVLSASTPNDGGFSPIVDFSALDISDNYQIRIEDSSDPTVFGLSEVFGIAEEAPVLAPPPFSFPLTDPIQVTSPGFQEVFPQAPDTTVSARPLMSNAAQNKTLYIQLYMSVHARARARRQEEESLLITRPCLLARLQIEIEWNTFVGLVVVRIALFSNDVEVDQLAQTTSGVAGSFSATLDTSALDAGMSRSLAAQGRTRVEVCCLDPVQDLSPGWLFSRVRQVSSTRSLWRMW